MTVTGTKMTHVPYRGTGPALNDIVAGHVDLIFMELSAAYKLHDGGKARILAVATDKRIDLLKDIPTMIEVGVPGFVSDTWNAISAPPRTPAPVVAKLNRTMNDIMKADHMRKRFAELNLVPVGGSPEDMRKLVQEETRRWGEVIRKAGIQPE
jgi:tripartite-type tricarboxylate transporter receptor subunit TctC